MYRLSPFPPRFFSLYVSQSVVRFPPFIIIPPYLHTCLPAALSRPNGVKPYRIHVFLQLNCRGYQELIVGTVYVCRMLCAVLEFLCRPDKGAFYTYASLYIYIYIRGRSRWPRGQDVCLRPLVCWDCGYESRQGHVCLLWVLCIVR